MSLSSAWALLPHHTEGSSKQKSRKIIFLILVFTLLSKVSVLWGNLLSNAYRQLFHIYALFSRSLWQEKKRLIQLFHHAGSINWFLWLKKYPIITKVWSFFFFCIEREKCDSCTFLILWVTYHHHIPFSINMYNICTIKFRLYISWLAFFH